MITDTRPLLDPAAVAAAQTSITRIVEALRRVILGKEDTIDEVVAALLGRGHVLLEGLPGLGKTELVKALSRLLSLDFRRINSPKPSIFFPATRIVASGVTSRGAIPVPPVVTTRCAPAVSVAATIAAAILSSSSETTTMSASS